jgi:hypothetical protein
MSNTESVSVQGRRTDIPYHARENFIPKCRLFPPARSDVAPLTFRHCLMNLTGFLICTPMLEEWRNRGSIEVHDGWVFQVSSRPSFPV